MCNAPPDAKLHVHRRADGPSFKRPAPAEFAIRSSTDRNDSRHHCASSESALSSMIDHLCRALSCGMAASAAGLSTVISADHRVSRFAAPEGRALQPGAPRPHSPARVFPCWLDGDSQTVSHRLDGHYCYTHPNQSGQPLIPTLRNRVVWHNTEKMSISCFAPRSVLPL